MQVSQDEIERLCQKSLEAHGVPAGADSESGWAAAWLESRGIGALAHFAADIMQCQGSFSIAPLSNGDEIDLAGKSLAFCGDGIADYIADLARRSNSAARIIVRNSRSPMFLIPHLHRHAKDKMSFLIRWRSGEANRRAQFARGYFAAKGLTLPHSPPEIADLEIIAADNCAIDFPACDGKEAQKMEAQKIRSLNSNIAVDDLIWRQIAEFAAAVLVPPSAESRMDAGAQENKKD